MDPIGQDILSRIQSSKGLEKSIIAGGYIRDNILGGKFKDIDIFIPNNEVLKAENKVDHAFNKIFSDDKFTFRDILTNTGYPSEFLVISGLFRETIPVQFMYTNIEEDNFVEKLFKTFDFNICKCYYNGERQIITEEAERDFENYQATLSFVRNQKDFGKSLERYYSWKLKYPNLKFKTNYELVNSEELRQREENTRKYYEEYYRHLYAGEPITTATGSTHPGYRKTVNPWIKPVYPNKLDWATLFPNGYNNNGVIG